MTQATTGIKVKYNDRTSRSEVTQHYYHATNVVVFSNIPPDLFWEVNQAEIVCVWRIKSIERIETVQP